MAKRKITFENGEFYHVYNRGVDKRNIIMNGDDINRMLESLAVFNTTKSVGSIYEHSRVNNQIGSNASKLVEIIAFNILGNHYHLILKQLVEGGISKFMHSFGTGYAKHFNEKYDRSGVLFQGPFKAVHIDSEEYLRYVIDYVNLNHLIHDLKSLEHQASKWGRRSSLEQYISSDRKSWKNKYFKCGVDFVIKGNKDYKDYEKNAKGMARALKNKKKESKLIIWKQRVQMGGNWGSLEL